MQRSLFALGVAVLMLSRPASSADQPSIRPNVLIIVADDMGFSDVGCYGGEIHTPNIDALAAGGLRWTQFFNCSRCCPTRASLLTGAYPHRVGLADNGHTLSPHAPTLAERLKAAGYETAMVGKWHLSELPHTNNEQQRIRWLNHQLDLGIPFADVNSYPTHRGFDRYYGVIWGVVDYFDPFSLTEGDQPVAQVPDGFYLTNAITERAVQDIKAFAATDAPSLLYVAYTAPHWPLHALPEDIATYRGRYDAGWDTLRKERFARQVALGLFPADTPLGAVQGPQPWKSLTADERHFRAAKMEVHAAMVDRVDQGIGRIRAALQETGQLENTVIFFLSDNGASPEIPGGPGYDRHGQTRDGRRALRDGELQQPGQWAKIGSAESYTGIGPAWASAANTPLRYWKKESYDGGCRTPLIVHWPSGLTAAHGSFCQDIGHVMDIAPTCLELAGVDSPIRAPSDSTATGARNRPSAGDEFVMDGLSLVPSLAGRARQGHDELCFEHEGGRGIRRGNWKASALAGQDWELFDAAADPGETQNLAAQHPEVLASLIADWDQWHQAVLRPGQ